MEEYFNWYALCIGELFQQAKGRDGNSPQDDDPRRDVLIDIRTPKMVSEKSSLDRCPSQGRCNGKSSPGEKGRPTMVVFRCSERMLVDDDRIDVNMIKILNLLDGYRSLASIAFAAGMSMSEFQKAIKALIALGLIEPVEAGKVPAGRIPG